jgi:hypothetical protein
MIAELAKLGPLVAGVTKQLSLQTVAGLAGRLLWKTAPRIDHLFESAKHQLAAASRNIGLLWAEYELGRMEKLKLLITYWGFRKTIRGLIGDGVNGWSFDRRINRGTSKDRIAQGGQVKRRFDDPSLVILVSRQVCLCHVNDN